MLFLLGMAAMYFLGAGSKLIGCLEGVLYLSGRYTRWRVGVRRI